MSASSCKHSPPKPESTKRGSSEKEMSSVSSSCKSRLSASLSVVHESSSERDPGGETVVCSEVSASSWVPIVTVLLLSVLSVKGSSRWSFAGLNAGGEIACKGPSSASENSESCESKCMPCNCVSNSKKR